MSLPEPRHVMIRLQHFTLSQQFNPVSTLVLIPVNLHYPVLITLWGSGVGAPDGAPW